MKIYSNTIFLNAGVLAVNFIIAWFGVRIDSYFGLANYASTWSIIIGASILVIGLVFRLWASHTFYSHGLKVLSLQPQQSLIQSGPYRYTRNPLYIGIILILLGWVLIFGSKIGLAAVILTATLLHLDLTMLDEKTLERKFGEEYRRYKLKVRRWL